MKQLAKLINNRKVLAFLDFEGTQFSHEMIAVGCVKVQLHRDMTVKRFYPGYHSYVIAKNRVGRIITDLTGISESMMKSGQPFRVVLNEIKTYLGRDYEKCLFVTFGSHDITILNSSLQHNLDAPREIGRAIARRHLDFDEFISQYVRDENGNTYSLVNMLKIFNVDFKGTPHDPLADALNLAYLYDAIAKDKTVLAEEYAKVLARGRHLPLPLQLLVQKLNAGKAVTPDDFHAYIKKAIE